FQAEDGIRDLIVTGVQTCALPISPIGNVQINIESVNPVNPLAHSYQVVGQIIGHGVHRAGIYVDGRLVTRLPVSRGADVSNFHKIGRASWRGRGEGAGVAVRLKEE